jgi:hypothetical protein
MDQRLAALSVLFSVVVISGCVGGGGGQGTESQGNQAIAVNQISVEPQEIFQGSNVRIRMSLTNVGELPAKLLVARSDANRNTGGQILTSYCPDIFSVESFSASSSNVSSTQRTYMLEPDYSVRLNWNLNQTGSEVPLNGYDCNLRFEVPFNYSVEAFRQIQVKDNPDVEGSEEIFAKSSQGPMKLELEAIGSSAPRGAPTFLKNDSAEILVQLVNKEPEEGSFVGTVSLGAPSISARGMQFDGSCPDPESVPESGTISLFQGQSKVFRCSLDWGSHDFGLAPSLRAEVFARANYTFVKTAGTKSVRVRYRGN